MKTVNLFVSNLDDPASVGIIPGEPENMLVCDGVEGGPGGLWETAITLCVDPVAFAMFVRDAKPWHSQKAVERYEKETGNKYTYSSGDCFCTFKWYVDESNREAFAFAILQAVFNAVQSELTIELPDDQLTMYHGG